jgi:hypothetical protein
MLIAFKIVTPLMPFEGAVANLIAGALLARLIEHKLRSRNIVSGVCSIGGELGLFVGVVEVSDVAAAIGIIEAEVSITGLLDQYQLAWFCESELVWRLALPERKGVAVKEFFTPDFLAFAKRTVAATTERAKLQILAVVERCKR